MTPTEKLAKELMCIYWNDSEKEIPPTEHALRLAKQVQRMVLDAQIKELENIDFFETETLWIKERIEKISKRLEELRSERKSLDEQG